MKHVMLLMLFALSVNVYAEPRVRAPVAAVQADKDCAVNFARMRMYHVMPRLLGEGTLDEVTRELPNARRMGINTLWISPPHPQTVYDDGLAGFNNHGYWPSAHGKIDPDLGGQEAFARLLAAAEKNDIRIAMDVVLNHFGPGAREYRIGRTTVQNGDPRYFKPREAGAPMIHPRERELWALLENERDPAKLMAYQEELSRFPLFGLAALEHDNPEVARYLINSYKKYVDQGVDIFRIDAPKHMRMSFLHRFSDEISAHAARKGRKVQFIWELLFDSPHTLNVFAEDVLKKVKDPKSAMFLDFPLSKELRKLEDTEKNYGLDRIWAFIADRQKNEHKLKHFIPMLENHDFEGPIKNVFRSKLAFALSEFASENATIIHHGSEVSGAAKTARPNIQALNPNGDKAQFLKTMAEAMAPYRAGTEVNRVIPHITEAGTMVLERRLPDRSIFAAANTTGAPGKKLIQLPRGAGTKIKVISSEGETTLTAVNGHVEWNFGKDALAVFEVVK